MTGQRPQGRASAALRMAIRLILILAVGYAGHLMFDWAELQSDYAPGTAGSLMGLAVMLLVLLAYAILIAIPFVPGVEVGLTILMMQGPSAAPGVYLATILGLMLGYAGGRVLPVRWLSGLFRDIGLCRAADLLERTAPLSPEARLETLKGRLPGWLGPLLAGWRYLLLAAVINLPGNWLLGGGGGIMMVAGLSRLFRPWPTVLTVALAVAPVPLVVWLFGIGLF